MFPPPRLNARTKFKYLRHFSVDDPARSIEEKLFPNIFRLFASFVPTNVHMCVRKSTVRVRAIVLSKSESENRWRMSCWVCRNSRNIPSYFSNEKQNASFEKILHLRTKIYLHILIERYDEYILFIVILILRALFVHTWFIYQNTYCRTYMYI